MKLSSFLAKPVNTFANRSVSVAHCVGNGFANGKFQHVFDKSKLVEHCRPKRR